VKQLTPGGQVVIVRDRQPRKYSAQSQVYTPRFFDPWELRGADLQSSVTVTAQTSIDMYYPYFTDILADGIQYYYVYAAIGDVSTYGNWVDSMLNFPSPNRGTYYWGESFNYIQRGMDCMKFTAAEYATWVAV
jgi:hypothetical protein